MARPTKEWRQNHIRYNWWKYLTVVLCAWIGWSVLFSVTAYRVPPERKIDIYFVGPYVGYENLEALKTELKAAMPDVEEFNCYPMTLEGDAESQSMAVQKLTLYMAAAEGDIYLLPRQWFLSFTSQDGCAPLDEYLASGALKPNGDYEKGCVTRKEGEFVGKHVFGVPLAEQYGLITREGFDNRNILAAVTSYSKNKDNAVRTIQWLIDNRTEEKPPQLK